VMRSPDDNLVASILGWKLKISL